MACEIDAFLTRQGLWNMHANLLRGCVQSRVQHNRHNLFRVCTFNVETFSSFNFFWVLSSRKYCRDSRYFISCLYKNSSKSSSGAYSKFKTMFGLCLDYICQSCRSLFYKFRYIYKNMIHAFGRIFSANCI